MKILRTYEFVAAPPAADEVMGSVIAGQAVQAVVQ